MAPAWSESLGSLLQPVWLVVRYGLTSQTFWTAFQALATGAAFLVVLIQLGKMRQQIQVTRETTGYDLLFRLNERFESPGTRKKRIACAATLKNALDRAPARTSLPDAFSEEQGRAIRALLDEFELVGFLVDRKVIDDHAVWTLFGYWIINYHIYCTETGYFEWERDPPTVYEHFVSLYQTMQEITKQKEGEEDEAREEFLDEELFLR